MPSEDQPTASASASIEETLGPDGPRLGRGVEPGSRVGRYLVVERIGAGAMGEVVSAYDPELDRKIAIKFMRPDALGSRTPMARARLLREAQALARLAHPNVVAVHDVGMSGQDVFVAMEFVRGTTLDRFLAEHRLRPRGVVELFLQAARGLSAAHEASLVHRDFKPTNVMVGLDGRVRVMDFGVVGITDGGPPTDPPAASLATTDTGASEILLTRAGHGVGTPAYMAPEQHAGAPADARADQFAFCVALFEALHGERPFAGETPAEIAAAVTCGTPRTPASQAKVPTWLHRVVLRGLATRPQDRYPSMLALIQALDPSRHRGGPRVAIAAVVIAVAAAGLGTRHLLHRNAVRACADESLALAHRWGERERADARAALLATELPYASTAAATVDEKLTAYVEQFSAASEQACLHANVDRDWSAEVVELAHQCLTERRRQTEALIDLLVAADAVVTEDAVGSVYSLPSPSQCADPGELARSTNLLRLGADAAEVAAELDRLALVDASARAGKHEEARQIVDDLVERAEALDSDLLRARVFFERGRSARTKGDPVGAANDFERAFFAATRLGYDEVAIAAATELGRASGALARFDEAERWTRHADAILVRRGIADGLARARLAGAQGEIATDRGDFALAVARHESALEMFRAHYGPDHPAVAQELDDLGFAYYEQGRFDDAFALLDEVLAIRRRTFGDEHPIVAGSHNDIGVAWLERGDLAQAESHLRRAVEMRERLYGQRSIRVAASLGNLAQVLDQRGRYEDAIALLERTDTIRREMLGDRHPSRAQVLANLAGAHRDLGRFERARELYEQALAIQEEALGPNHPHTAYVLGGLASLASRRGDHALARAYLQRALRVREAGAVDALLVTETRLALADANWRSGDHEAAIDVVEQGLASPKTSVSGGARAQLERWLADHRGGTAARDRP